MACEFRLTRRVEFSDTDLAGIVNYANYFRYMEATEHAFFRSLGFSVAMSPADPPLGWPRVRAECDYRYPLYFEDLVEIHLLVTEKRSKSLSYEFRFRKLNSTPIVEAARGRLTVVCVTQQRDRRMAAATIPKSIADRIEVAPKELLE